MKKKLKMLLLLITTCVLIVSGANVTTSYASGGRMRQGHTGAHLGSDIQKECNMYCIWLCAV